MDILIYPFEGENPVFTLGHLTNKSPMIRICRLIYKVLKLCAKNNQPNKLYIAQWISHFFTQSMQANENNTMNAQETISELLNNNKALLENGINESTIENIVENCRNDCKNEKYLKLLSSLMECNNEAISNNQDFVCSFILEDYAEPLIKVEPAGDS